MAKEITRQMKKLLKILLTLVAVVLAGVVLVTLLTPWMDRWGATDAEINATLPGDEFIAEPAGVVNRAVTIHASPEQIYPWIAKNVRGKIAFRTDIDRQYALPFGSPSQVKETVQQVFEACGTAQGGLIACGEIGPDVPLENIRAMYAAFREYAA
jgi:hypothetical protein